MSPLLWSEIGYASLETGYMVLVSTLLASLLGVPLGILLHITSSQGLKPHFFVSRLLGGVVNVMRSIPFVILMITLIPLTRWLIGSAIGTSAAIVSLTLGALPVVARLVSNALGDISRELVVMARALGASHWQIVWRVLLPEAAGSMIKGIILTMIMLVGYSAMAGTLGGGGLGDLAVRYGYQRFDERVMFITVIILVGMVQLIQYVGDRIVQRFDPLSHNEGV